MTTLNKFEFKVTKLESGGKIWTHYISIRATDRQTATARIQDIFPTPEYEHEFVEPC